jgi:hypothetical protein
MTTTPEPTTNFFGQVRKKVEIQQDPHCYFCSEKVDSDDICYGCGQYVCQMCDHFDGLGNHDVSEHKGISDEVGLYE